MNTIYEIGFKNKRPITSFQSSPEGDDLFKDPVSFFKKRGVTFEKYALFVAPYQIICCRYEVAIFDDTVFPGHI